MKLVLDVADNKASVLLEILMNISFVNEVKEVADGEITNPSVLKSIDDYENGRVQPTPCNMEDLKSLINA